MKTLVVRCLAFLAVAAAIVGSATVIRRRLLAETERRMAGEYQQTIAALPARQAAALIERLAQDDERWLSVLVVALADERPAVVRAASDELLEAVDRWAKLPPAESSPLVANLAGLLAEHAPQLLIEHRAVVHSLAQRLLDWPVDSRRIDAAKWIANCQSVLLLPVTESTNVRIAITPPRPTLQPSAPPPVTAPAIPMLATPANAPHMVAAPRLDPPQPVIPVEPAPLGETSGEQMIEPRQFIAPRGLRISDE